MWADRFGYWVQEDYCFYLIAMASLKFFKVLVAGLVVGEPPFPEQKDLYIS
jgi:hypothetical protein